MRPGRGDAQVWIHRGARSRANEALTGQVSGGGGVVVCVSSLLNEMESQQQKATHCLTGRLTRSLTFSVKRALYFARIRTCPERHVRMGGARPAQPLDYSYPVVQAPL